MVWGLPRCGCARESTPPPAPLTHSFCRYVNRGQGLRARLPWVPKPLDLFKSVCISLPTHHVWILQFTSEQRFLMSISGKFLPGGPSAVWSGEPLGSALTVSSTSQALCTALSSCPLCRRASLRLPLARRARLCVQESPGRSLASCVTVGKTFNFSELIPNCKTVMLLFP